MKISYIVIFVAIATGGCTAPPLKVDVERRDTNTVASTQVIESSPHIAKISFINNKKDSALENKVFDDTYIPIRTEPATKQTVQGDIHRFLTEVLLIDPLARTNLTVKIQQAEAFWVLGVVDRIPFIGLATAGADRNFLLNLRFVIDVEQDGKVKSTYSFEESFLTRGSAAFSSSIKKSYEKLIEDYRKRLQKELQADFVARYL